MKNISSVIILVVQVLALGTISMVFINRSPVLVVTDASFAALYGIERVKLQQVYSSLNLFRPVKNVELADGISDDVLIITLQEKSVNPYCIIFHSSFSSAAEYYHREYPNNLLVLLGGRNPEDSLPQPDETLYIYASDTELDLYRAGYFSGLLNIKDINIFRLAQILNVPDVQEKKIIGLTIDDSITDLMQNTFSRGVDEISGKAEIIYAATSSDLPQYNLSSVVFAGSCDDFLDKPSNVPVILFSWLDPVFTSDNVIIVLDDSPWAQTITAVKMAEQKQKKGRIPSKILIFPDRIADNGIFRKINEGLKKTFN